MNIRERILALLSERPMSVQQLRKAIGLTPSQMELLTRELTTLNRERAIRTSPGGGWKINPEADVTVSNGKTAAIAAKLEQKAEAAAAPPLRKTTASDVTNHEPAPPLHVEQNSDELPDALIDQLSKAEQKKRRPSNLANWQATPESRDAAHRDRERILGVIAERGPLKATDMVAALGGDLTWKTITNRCARLLRRGQIIKTKAGYELPSNTVADALDVRVPEDQPSSMDYGGGPFNGLVESPVPTAEQAAHTVRISTCQIDPDASPEVMGAIREMAQRFVGTGVHPTGVLAAPPLADLRAKLMHTIDLVHENKLSLDDVRGVLKLADGIAAIDGYAS